MCDPLLGRKYYAGSMYQSIGNERGAKNEYELDGVL